MLEYDALTLFFKLKYKITILEYTSSFQEQLISFKYLVWFSPKLQFTSENARHALFGALFGSRMLPGMAN